MTFHPRARGGGLSRRQFLQRSAGTAIALPSFAAILAACGGDGDGPTGDDGDTTVRIGSPDDPVTQPIFEDNPAIASDLEPEPGPLRIYNWADYLRPRTLKEFGEEFGVEVELTTFYNEEEALRKLRTGEIRMDVYFPTSEIVSKIVAGQILQPLNHDYLPNLQPNVWPFLADPFYDKGSQYTVPYTVYQTGIGWRTDMVDTADVETDNPWDVFWNAKYKDFTGLYDDFEEALTVSLFRLGVADPVTATEDQVNQAADELIKLVDLVNIRYTIDGAYSGLPQGKFGLHQAWSGDMVATPYYYAKGDDPETARYLWPPYGQSSTVGGLIANDCMAIPKNAEHPVLGHLFLNYMLDEGNALKNFGWVGYQPPQNGLDPDSLVADGWVAEWLETAVVRPEDFEADLGIIPRQLPPENEAFWVDAWSRVQQGG